MPTTISSPATAKWRISSLGPGGPRFASVMLRLEPTPTDSRPTIDASACVYRCVPPHENDLQHYLYGIQDGVRSYAEEHDLVGVDVIVQEIQAHPIASSREAFKSAARLAMVDAVKKAGIIAR